MEPDDDVRSDLDDEERLLFSDLEYDDEAVDDSLLSLEEEFDKVEDELP